MPANFLTIRWRRMLNFFGPDMMAGVEGIRNRRNRFIRQVKTDRRRSRVFLTNRRFLE